MFYDYISIFQLHTIQEHKLISSETTYCTLNSRHFKAWKHQHILRFFELHLRSLNACFCAFINALYDHVRMLCYLNRVPSIQWLIHVNSYELDVWYCMWSTWELLLFLFQNDNDGNEDDNLVTFASDDRCTKKAFSPRVVDM